MLSYSMSESAGITPSYAPPNIAGAVAEGERNAVYQPPVRSLSDTRKAMSAEASKPPNEPRRKPKSPSSGRYSGVVSMNPGMQ